jgi:uroporphyrinogen III methyltransferase/synthase
MTGKVVLVGAGPGDPDLITVKGRWYLERCNALVHDDLVAPELLKLAPRHAPIIDVGKRKGRKSMDQSEINALLVRLAHDYALVVRLKGGDPLLFGRGGEELLALRQAGVPFEVVPGISSALAAPAYAGIPATHRGISSELIVRTGHEAEVGASREKTVVYLMAASRLSQVTDQLVAEGLSPDTPAALVQWATRGRQRTLATSLGQIALKASEVGIASPAVLIVGSVVNLRQQLRWFDTTPLSGKRVLVTRLEDGESRLAASLRTLGAEVIHLPTIEIRWPESWDTVDQAIYKLANYQWLVLTSPRGVDVLRARLSAYGLDARHLAPVRIAAVGSGTASALASLGIRADLVPKRFTSMDLAQEMIAKGISGQRVLLARADIANPSLPQALRGAGAEVDEVTLYRTILASSLPAGMTLEVLEAMDVACFTSASAAEGLVHLLGDHLKEVITPNTLVAAIGPVTAERVRGLGMRVGVVAEEHTFQGLLKAILKARRAA